MGVRIPKEMGDSLGDTEERDRGVTGESRGSSKGSDTVGDAPGAQQSPGPGSRSAGDADGPGP